jgi:signal peptidase I
MAATAMQILSTDREASIGSAQGDRPATRTQRVSRTVVEIVLAIGLLLILWQAAFSVTSVSDLSMLPNFESGEQVLVSKATYVATAPHRSDVALVSDPNKKTSALRRIIGIPGDRVEVRAQQVFVNGLPINESYASGIFAQSSALGSTLDVRLKANEYFVLPDNRVLSGLSLDSRNSDLVRSENIIGRAWVIIWPPTNAGIVQHQPEADTPIP